MEKIKTYYGENKSLVLGLVGIVVFIAIIVLANSFFSLKSSDIDDKVSAEDKSAEVAPTYYSKGSVKAVVPAPKISYADALLKYKSSTLQFSDKCEALTFKYVFKNGTEVMIDNRGTAKTFSVGENKVSIGAYDFAVVKLQADVFPKTVTVDCGTRQNVSEIRIEK